MRARQIAHVAMTVCNRNTGQMVGQSFGEATFMRLAFAVSAVRAFAAPAAPYRHLPVDGTDFQPEERFAFP